MVTPRRLSYEDAGLMVLARLALADGRAKEARVACGMTQAEVAAVCKVTPGAVTHWERRSRTPRGREAVAYGRLLQQLGVDSRPQRRAAG